MAEQEKPSRAYIEDQQERQMYGEPAAIPPGQDVVLERRLMGPSEPEPAREEMGGPRSRFLYQGEPPREPGFSVNPPATPPEPPQSPFADRRTWAKMLLGIGAGAGNQQAMQMLNQMREEEGMVDLGTTISQSRALWESGDRKASLARFDQLLQSPALRTNPKLFLAATQHRVQMGQEMVRLNMLQEGLARINAGDDPMQTVSTLIGSGADTEAVKQILEAIKLSQGNFDLKVVGDTGYGAVIDKRTGKTTVVDIAGAGNTLVKPDAVMDNLAIQYSPKGPDGMPLYPGWRALAKAAQMGMAGAVQAFSRVSAEYPRTISGEVTKTEETYLTPEISAKYMGRKFPYEQPPLTLRNKEFAPLVPDKYVSVPSPQAREALLRSSVAGTVLGKLEKVVRDNDYMFPSEVDPKSAQARSGLRLRGRVWWQEARRLMGEGRFDKAFAEIEGLKSDLAGIVKALGDTGNISVTERQMAEQALSMHPMTREAALVQLNTVREIVQGAFTSRNLELPPSLRPGGGKKLDWKTVPLPPGLPGLQ